MLVSWKPFQTHELSTKPKVPVLLRTGPFPLNADEPTDLNTDWILNVLVCFCEDNLGKNATQHLACRKVNIADTSTFMLELKRYSRQTASAGNQSSVFSWTAGQWWRPGVRAGEKTLMVSEVQLRGGRTLLHSALCYYNRQSQTQEPD